MPLTPNTFSQLINFSRASSAQRVNEQSILETVAAGYPRYDYAPMPELLTAQQQALSGAAGWDVSNGGGWVIANGNATVTATGGGQYLRTSNLQLVAGKTYAVRIVSSNASAIVLPNLLPGGANGYPAVSGNAATLVFVSGANQQFGIWCNTLGVVVYFLSLHEVQAKGLLIEEARTNLFLASNQISTGGVGWQWSASAISLRQNAALAPDGTYGATFVSNFTGSDFASLYQSVTAVSGTTYTASFFVKAGSSTVVHFRAISGATDVTATYDLSAKTAANYSGTCAPTITDVGGGWLRISIQIVAAATSLGLYLYPRTQYASSTPGGVYLWGAQCEAGAFATSYIPTPSTFASRASSASFFDSDGLLKTAASNVARLGYDPATRLPLGLLVEPAATNLAINSANLLTSWNPNGGTYVANFGVAPDGTTISSQWSTAMGEGRWSNFAAMVEGSTYTASVFVKRTSGTGTLKFGPESPAQYVVFDLNAMAVSSVTGSAVGAVQSLGSGWYRLSTTFTLLSGSNKNIVAYGQPSAGSLVFEVWGAQLEQVSQALGSELVSNGAFVQDATGWSQANGANALSVVSGQLNIGRGAVNRDDAYQTINVTAGKQYTITYNAVGNLASSVANGTANGNSDLVGAAVRTNGVITHTVVPTGSQITLAFWAQSFSSTGIVDNVSVKETAGVQLVTNGDFSSATGWVLGTGWAISGGVATMTTAQGSSSNLSQSIAALSLGKLYQITFDLTVTAGSATFYIGNQNAVFTTSGTKTVTLQNDGSGIAFVAAAGFTGSVDNVSVRDAQNLVLNGTFNVDASNWTAAAGAALSVVSGRIRVTNSTINGQATQTITGLTIGRTYQVSALVDRQTSANATLQVSGFGYKDNAGVAATISYNFVATGTSISLQLQCSSNVNGAYSDFDNVSLTDVTELVSNGAFEGMLTGWAAGATGGSGSVANGQMTVAGTVSNAVQGMGTPITCVVGKQYVVKVDLISASTGNRYVRVATTNNPTASVVYLDNASFAIGTNALAFIATQTTYYIYVACYNTGDTVVADNISVKDVTPAGSATSYIATTSAAVTRAADVTSSATVSRARDDVSLAAIAPWYNATEGTIYAEVTFGATPASGGCSAITFRTFDGGYVEQMCLSRRAGGGGVQFAVRSGGTDVYNVTTANGAVALGVSTKLAGAYKAGSFAFSCAGALVNSGTTGAVPSIDRVAIGSLGLANGEYLNGWIKNLAYYPRKLSDAELVALTT